MSNKKQVDYDQMFNLAKIGLTEEQMGVSLGISVAIIGRRMKLLNHDKESTTE